MSVREIRWDEMALQADPLADRTIAAIVGPWGDGVNPSPAASARLAQATRLMAQWTTNASLDGWSPSGLDPEAVAALRAYLDAARQPPAWMRPEDVATAEATFMDYGPLSCTLLFCASLPECYVLPHLSEVLHIAGQLEARTEYRIRQTAAMVFPVMMRGGLTQGDGGGIAQVLKVRLIHATIRHLILRGSPEDAGARVAPVAGLAPDASLFQALMGHGWDVRRQGLPCNQLELAYTLLTFSYVFLRGLRKLGTGLSPEQERAYLHTWNVAGSVLGIREDLLAQDMDEAEAMFAQLQALARAHPADPDVRPPLGRALMDTMARSIEVPVLRHLPVPMTRWLVGRQAAREIGADQRVGLPTLLLFHVGRLVTLGFDKLVRLVIPGFSLTRMFTRVVGYHMLSRLLLDQTRPLGLPEELVNPMRRTIAGWRHDVHAPRWVNRLEARLNGSAPT